MSYESAVQQWREGERRLAEADPSRVRLLERIVERIYLELRRRLGSSFLTDELVDLYEAGTSWAQDIAVATAPDDPWAWDARTVVDAAFARYLREASDYAGGRRLTPDA
jgi:predicted nucleic acid-binding protein